MTHATGYISNSVRPKADCTASSKSPAVPPAVSALPPQPGRRPTGQTALEHHWDQHLRQRRAQFQLNSTVAEKTNEEQ